MTRRETLAAAALIALTTAACGGASRERATSAARLTARASKVTPPAPTDARPLPRPSRVWLRLRRAGVPLELADLPVIDAGPTPRPPRFDLLLPPPAGITVYGRAQAQITFPNDGSPPVIERGASTQIVRHPTILDLEISPGELVFEPRDGGASPRFLVLLYRDRALLDGQERLVAASISFARGRAPDEYLARRRPACAVRYFPAAGAALETCSDVPTTNARDRLVARAVRALTAAASDAA